MDNTAKPRIVAGVDGSAASKAALTWSFKQAALTGARVHALTAWEFPAFYSWEGGPMPPEDFSNAARQALDDTVDEVLETTRFSGEVHRDIVQGHSARVLLEAAEKADLLVVGSRGHGGFVGALLGSVSQKCAHHASCPVVIVRAEPPRRS